MDEGICGCVGTSLLTPVIQTKVGMCCYLVNTIIHRSKDQCPIIDGFNLYTFHFSCKLERINVISFDLNREQRGPNPTLFKLIVFFRI